MNTGLIEDYNDGVDRGRTERGKEEGLEGERAEAARLRPTK